MRGSHRTVPVRKAPPRPKDDPNNNATSLGNNNKKKLKKVSYPSAVMSHAQQQPWARPFTWSQHREIITRLYIVDDLPLKEVEEIMRKDFQFYATHKMYKDHFRKWGLRKNLSSQYVQDLLRTRPQNSPPAAHSPNGAAVVGRNLDRRVNRYLHSKPGWGPNAEITHFLLGIGLPRQYKSPGSLGDAERSMYIIRDCITAMDSHPRTGALGPAYNAAAGKTYHWITLIGIARNFVHQKRYPLGFALLNRCFDIFRGMLEPNPWLILAAFYGAYDLARIDPQLATIFMKYIDELTTTTAAPHAFHDLFVTLRQSGSDGVREQFETVILGHFMDTMAGSFREKKMVLDIMRSFSRGFIRAFPRAMPSIDASPATVQKAFDSLKGKPDSLLIPLVSSKGQPNSGLDALVNFPVNPMEDFLQGWTNTRPPPNSPSPSASSLSIGTPIIANDTGSEGQGTNKEKSPPVFDPSIILKKVVEESSVELRSGNLSVTARLMDLKGCFGNPSGEYRDIEVLRPAYEYLMGFYMPSFSLYLPH